jgi:two-component system, NtrC family, response regulator AtoC
MKKPGGSGDEAITVDGLMHVVTPTDRLSVVVINEVAPFSRPLPQSGTVTIGRSSTAELVVNDPSLSRHHAVIHVEPVLAIEDLGSSNGTRVRGERIPPRTIVPIRLDEVVEVGSTMIVVQRRSAPMRPRMLLAHDYFEIRLNEECARSERSGGRFGVFHLHCSSAEERAPAIQDALAGALRAMDVVGLYAPNEYELLIVDAAPEEVEAISLRVRTALAAISVSARLSAATYPNDGRDADSLMARLFGSSEVSAEHPRFADGTMRELYRLVERIAPSPICVLILGETGVGKEVMAETIHRRSARANKPLVKIHCAALSESLFESELFGHERGAFTGALEPKQGLIESADGGTVLLDEIGELSATMQVKLLRLVETRQVQRVGSVRPKEVDVRFIAATNRDLEEEVARGAFRQDLYFRLNGVSLVIPPLRERPGEIEALARSFIQRSCRAAGRSDEPTLTQRALEVLRSYSWPGNIRELRNVIDRAVLLSSGRAIEPAHLPLEKMRSTFAAKVVQPETSSRPSPPAVEPHRTLDASLEDEVTIRPARGAKDQAHRLRVLKVLEDCGGNQTHAAKKLGVSRRTLINWLDSWGVTRPRKGR